jgi:hypothetical protein
VAGHPDAIPATLLDLAARDYVDLDQYGPERTVCRVRRTDTSGLQPYERMVLEHVAGLAVEGIVLADALTTGPGTSRASGGGGSSATWSKTRDGLAAKVKAWKVVSALPGGRGH